MLDTIFYMLLNMSIIGSLMGLLLVILRRIKQIPRFAVYILWSTVFLRLSIPVALASRLSLLSFTGGLIKRVVDVGSPVKEEARLTMANSIGAARNYFPVIYKSNFLENILGIAAIVWLIGALVAAAGVIVLYYLSSREQRSAVLACDNIYFNEGVSVPIVHGIFRQRIIIPAELLESEVELKYVLFHERIHVKRHDNLYRLMAVFITSIHWFNPFAWFFLKLFLEDLELACDAGAIKGLSVKERREYAGTLANLGTGKKVFMTSAFSKTNFRTRVLNVVNYKKLSFLGIILSLLFITSITILVMTNPVK